LEQLSDGEVSMARGIYLASDLWSFRGDCTTTEFGFHSRNIQKRLASRTEQMTGIEIKLERQSG